jgi:hypothetical protein
MSARGERKGIEDERRNPKKKTHSAEYGKGAHGPDEPTKETEACGGGWAD